MQKDKTVGDVTGVDGGGVLLDAVEEESEADSGGDFVDGGGAGEDDEDIFGSFDFFDDFFDEVALSGLRNSSGCGGHRVRIG